MSGQAISYRSSFARVSFGSCSPEPLIGADVVENTHDIPSEGFNPPDEI